MIKLKKKGKSQAKIEIDLTNQHFLGYVPKGYNWAEQIMDVDLAKLSILALQKYVRSKRSLKKCSTDDEALGVSVEYSLSLSEEWKCGTEGHRHRTKKSALTCIEKRNNSRNFHKNTKLNKIKELELRLKMVPIFFQVRSYPQLAQKTGTTPYQAKRQYLRALDSFYKYVNCPCYTYRTDNYIQPKTPKHCYPPIGSLDDYPDISPTIMVEAICNQIKVVKHLLSTKPHQMIKLDR